MCSDEAFVTVVLTRISDTFLTLTQRANICNSRACHSFVSIHFNSASSLSAKGREIFTTRGQNNSDKLADKIEAQNERFLPLQKSRRDFTDGDPDKEANFSVIRRASCPAVLVEGEFIHTEAGARLIKDAGFRQSMANAIAYGILDFHGIDYSTKSPSAPQPKPLTIEQRLARLEQKVFS